MGFCSSLTLAKLTMGLIGIATIVFGLWYMEQSTEYVREQHLVEYEKIVNVKWPMARRFFEGLGVTARVSNSSTVVLVANTSTEPVEHDEYPGELPEYTPLVYRASGVVLKGDVVGSALKDIAMTVRIVFTLNGTELETGPLPLLSSRRVRCGREVQYSRGRCWFYYKLRHICVQVEKTSDNSWQFARRVPSDNQSYGCNYRGGKWSVPAYEEHPVNLPVDSASLEVQPSLPFDQVTFEVRSSADPHLVALSLTQGSLDFGLSSETELFLGLTMIIFGTFFICPAGCVLRTAWRRWRKKGAARFTSRSESWRAAIARSRARQNQNVEIVGMKYMVDEDADTRSNEADLVQEQRELG